MTTANDCPARDAGALADDLLTGAPAIGAFLGWAPRKVYYVASQKYLPITQCGKLLIARKSELAAALSCKSGKAA